MGLNWSTATVWNDRVTGLIFMRGDLRQYSVSNSIMTNLQFPVPSSEPKLDQQNRNWEVGTEIELTEQKLRS